MNRDQTLKEMGLGPIWKLRQPPKKKKAPAAARTDARTEAIAAMGWEELQQAVADCQACELCKTRKQAVLGVGDPAADWLFVGEGPGADEDACGEPFVGKAGKLLDNMLAAIDLSRNSPGRPKSFLPLEGRTERSEGLRGGAECGKRVYIANVVKCRPPDNRTPEPGETAACWPFLARQIELIQPQLIVTLGKPAAQTLLQQEVKIADFRGQVHDFAGMPLIVTYHPAYLLRSLLDKAKAWEDLCFMRQTMKNIQGGCGVR